MNIAFLLDLLVLVGVRVTSFACESRLSFLVGGLFKLSRRRSNCVFVTIMSVSFTD